MGVLDGVVTVGKKILPPPAILLFSHIIFGVFGTIMLCLNLMSSPDNLWSSYVTLFIGGVPLCVGMSYIKYKQTDSIVAAIISGFVFFCTIVAIQYWPWSAWLNTTKRETGYNFARLLILLPLSFIYGLWCKKTIEQFVYVELGTDNGKFTIEGDPEDHGYNAASTSAVPEIGGGGGLMSGDGNHSDAQDTDSFL